MDGTVSHTRARAILQKSSVFLLVLLLTSSMYCVPSALAKDEVSENSVITGIFYSPEFVISTNDGADIPIFYRYSDEYFSGSTSTYDIQLADMSLCLAMATMPSARKASDFSDADRNAVALLDELGFENVESESLTSVPTTDSIAAAFATKQIEDEWLLYTCLGERQEHRVPEGVGE